MIGEAGEKFFSLVISRKTPRGYLFMPAFTGDKWPGIDFYVEVISKKGGQFAFFQVKTTTKKPSIRKKNLLINISKDKLNKLSQHLAPTYLVCVYLKPTDPTQSKIFIKTIRGRYRRSISSVTTLNELNHTNLINLKREIKEFWKSSRTKQSKINYKTNF